MSDWLLYCDHKQWDQIVVERKCSILAMDGRRERFFREYKELQYGYAEEIDTDMLYLTDVLGTPGCERHECCGASIQVNDVVIIRMEPFDHQLRHVARRFDVGFPHCAVGFLHKHITGAGLIHFMGAIAQVVEVFDDQDTLDTYFSKKFQNEILKLNGVAKCIVLKNE